MIFISLTAPISIHKNHHYSFCLQKYLKNKTSKNPFLQKVFQYNVDNIIMLRVVLFLRAKSISTFPDKIENQNRDNID